VCTAHQYIIASLHCHYLWPEQKGCTRGSCCIASHMQSLKPALQQLHLQAAGHVTACGMQVRTCLGSTACDLPHQHALLKLLLVTNKLIQWIVTSRCLTVEVLQFVMTVSWAISQVPHLAKQAAGSSLVIHYLGELTTASPAVHTHC
jgi:hypothetical protein